MFPEGGRLLSGQQSSTSSRLLYDGLPCILGSARSSTLRPSKGELGLTTHSVDRSSILTLGGNKERLQRSHQGLPSDRGRHFYLRGFLY
ncbi:hypothetical protein TSUD_199160, partial [Trifolium subterraneum]